MNGKNDIGVAVTTCSNRESASLIVNELLEAGLVACGQIEEPVESVYQWKGKVEKEKECRITMKFDLEKRQELELAVKRIHPYETPQWVVWKAEASRAYYDWVSGAK